MSETNKKTENNSGGNLERVGLVVFAALGAVAAASTKVAWTGIKKINFKEYDFWFLFFSFLFFALMITYGDYHYLKWLNLLMPDWFSENVIGFLRKIPKTFHFLAILIGAAYTVGIALGFVDFFKRRKLQKQLDLISLANAKGDSPKVVAEIELDQNKSKLLVSSIGVGVDRFEAKKSDLESTFHRIVEGVSFSEDRKFIEIKMCKRELRKMLSYYEAVANIKKPYHFLVGETMDGIIVCDLRELPHLLIAGSTGGGKSVYFRQAMLTLLKYSPRLQVYLIDLKRGVEVKEFSELPNVRVAKDEDEAVLLLESLVAEMKKRFAYMEKKGSKKIDPEKDQMDVIVVGIDEASVLFGKTSSSKEKANLVAKARELTDELAKLSRAAGIHLIIATQKAVKESLDTKVLENLTGRMVFKMSTHAGSNTALGNVKAYSLPDIKGRGIWGGGNKYLEVQAPFLSEKELADECQALAGEYDGDAPRFFGPMIEVENLKSKTETDTMALVKPQSEQQVEAKTTA